MIIVDSFVLASFVSFVLCSRQAAGTTTTTKIDDVDAVKRSKRDRTSTTEAAAAAADAESTELPERRRRRRIVSACAVRAASVGPQSPTRLPSCGKFRLTTRPLEPADRSRRSVPENQRAESAREELLCRSSAFAVGFPAPNLYA